MHMHHLVKCNLHYVLYSLRKQGERERAQLCAPLHVQVHAKCKQEAKPMVFEHWYKLRSVS